MSEEGMIFVMVIIGWPVFIITGALLLAPSQMQLCIKAGYEWRGGDCVMAVEHD
jgi:hypothetical protein